MLCGPQGPTNPQRPRSSLHGALCRCVAGSGQSTASEVSGTPAAGPASLPSRCPGPELSTAQGTCVSRQHWV